LNSVERVELTLTHSEPDKVPLFDFLYNPLSLRKFLGDAEIMPARVMKVWLSLGFDLACLGFDDPVGHRQRPGADGTYVDEWGVLNRIEGEMSWYVGGTIKRPEDLDALEGPDPLDEGRYRTLKWALREYSDRVACAVAVPGIFTQAWSMMGFPAFVKALYGNPAFIQNLLSRLTDHFTEMGRRAIDLGANLLWISDDLGGTKGPMISPLHFRSLVLPCMRRMVRSFKRRGAWVLLHCDGNVMPLMTDIVSIGVDAFHPIERKTGMDLSVMKESYGGRITLIGNLEASHLIPWGTRDEIREQIFECLRIGAPGAGYIFASDHSIHPAISAWRARFVYETADRYRRYGGRP